MTNKTTAEVHWYSFPFRLIMGKSLLIFQPDMHFHNRESNVGNLQFRVTFNARIIHCRRSEEKNHDARIYIRAMSMK